MKKIFAAVAGFVLVGYVSAPAYAFTPLQAPILSAAAVAPNVVVLLDNSGSMNNAIQPLAVESSNYASVYYRSNGNWVLANVVSSSNIQLRQIDRNDCASGYRALWNSSGNGRRCYRLPDPVGDGYTRYTGKYLAYIYNTYTAGSNDLRSVLPNDFRMRVARNVTESIVTANRGLRYGLFTFNSAVDSNFGPGGSLREDVRDFSRSVKPDGTVLVTTAQAQANFDNFVNKIRGVTASSNTPLAESYYEVTRYMRGLSRYQGEGSGNYTSPIQYRCQRNFGIVVTDGLPTFDRSFPADDLENNPAVPGGDNLPNWDGVSNDGNNPDNGDNEGDSLYLDDIAKFAYDIDLKASGTDLAGKSFNSSGFSTQNMLTYTVGFAVSNQMLADAAFYGKGRYYTASNSQQLNDSLTKAINEISSKAGSGGAGASSSATLTTETYYYKTLYDPKDWRGTIEAYLLNPDTGRPTTVSPVWTTDSTITPGNNSATYQTFKTGPGGGVVALDYSNVSAEQQAELNSNVTAPLNGASLLSWVKGNNVSGLRNRQVLLGDVINSTLSRMSPDEVLASGDSSYTSFLEAKKSGMTSSLLVNANDGLFHVINAKTGAHRYGYLPSSLYSSLHLVAAQDYATSGSHNFMVDGPITVADAELSGSWATVAVGGMGAGGKSQFAIKLFGAGGGGDTINALWEVSPPSIDTPSDPWNDLGYSYSKAVVARTQDGSWVAIFGNGYGSYDGKAALYVVDMSDGSLVRKIVVDANDTGTPAEIAAGNGLSSPQVVLNAQHQIMKVYAGDLRGNLWEIDGESWSSSKLFSAGSGSPITAQPLVVENKAKSGHMVLFGTGKLSEASDKLDKSLQSFYGIWDAEDNDSTVLKSELLAQSITGEKVINGESYLTTSNLAVDWDVNKGWYLPLSLNGALQGERVVYPAQETNGQVVFVTAKVDALDPCESTGSGRLVELDLFSGGALTYPVLDTNGDGQVDKTDELVSGLNIDDGLPGLPVIIDSGEKKSSQTKVILLSTGVAKFIDEYDPPPPPGCEKDCDPSAGTVSKRIMWRQIQ